MHVRKNDTVVVLSGKDKGKKGTVLLVNPKDEMVVVKDVNVVTRHAKARRQGDVAGIKKEEAPIHISNVMRVCTSCKEPSRTNTKEVEGKRVRACNSCKEII